MEESAEYTVSLVRKFLDSPTPASPVHSTEEQDVGEKRLTPSEFQFPQQGNPGTGSSGVSGIQTVVLKGDPNETGVYTIMLRVPRIPRSTRIRTSMIVSQRSFQELGGWDTETTSTNRN